MAPIPTKDWVKKSIDSSAIIMFAKTTCPFCKKLKKELTDNGFKYGVVEIDEKSNTAEIQDSLNAITGIRTVPQLFIHGKFIGGCDKSVELMKSGQLKNMLTAELKFDYDLIVIGGGSGGLSASKEAAQHGAKVALLDFVEPTPMGTTWGIGGTCVNVGCIPKKLMHRAAVHSHNFEDSDSYGWSIDKANRKHNWQQMVGNVQSYIKSLNFGYRTSLKDSSVEYLNEFGVLVDPNTVECTNKRGEKKKITAKNIILAMGERPRYPGVPGDKECCITSDDLFSLPYNPGRTLVVGASYVALECAGFLAALGNDVTVMVRSIFLRGFDQDMATRVGDYMEKHGVKFIKECVPTKFEQTSPIPADKSAPGKVKVTGKFVSNGTEYKETYDTVILAIGRDSCTKNINADKLGISLDKVGRVICDTEERTSVPNIYAIGDIVSEKLQLTPVAIEAGRNLARRLYTGGDTLTNYENVATTVFTPLEYGAIGLAEEDAIKRFGQEDIEVFHSYFKPLEWTIAGREDNVCYAKLICVKSQKERVVGFHYLGPDAGEVTQGFALGIRLGATKEDFDRTIGIHPTCAEIFTTLRVTKNSGISAEKKGC